MLKKKIDSITSYKLLGYFNLLLFILLGLLLVILFIGTIKKSYEIGLVDDDWFILIVFIITSFYAFTYLLSYIGIKRRQKYGYLSSLIILITYIVLYLLLIVALLFFGAELEVEVAKVPLEIPFLFFWTIVIFWQSKLLLSKKLLKSYFI